MNSQACASSDTPMATPVFDRPLRVLKLGGSLLDLPDLRERFNRYRDSLFESSRPTRWRLLMVVGGSEAADVVRRHARSFALEASVGHDLAVHAMAFNAHCVSRILHDCPLATSVDHAHQLWQAETGAVVAAPVAWLQEVEKQGVAIKRSWQFTSDSIAAAIAAHLHAQTLTLLKSTLPTTVRTRRQAMETGLVDGCFNDASRHVAHVEVVNLRQEPWQPVTLEKD